MTVVGTDTSISVTSTFIKEICTGIIIMSMPLLTCTPVSHVHITSAGYNHIEDDRVGLTGAQMG
jgi:hypothetical protein